MVQQIPNEELLDYFPYFKNHKLANLLAQCLVRSTAIGYVDSLENPEILAFKGYLWYLTGNYKSSKLKEILAKIPEKNVIILPEKKNQEWATILKRHWKFVSFFPRTALSAKKLSLAKIKKLIKPLPKEFELKQVDVATSKHLESHWPNSHKITHSGGPEKFVKEFIAFCIKEGEKVVSLGCSDKSSIRITKSVEVDVQTLAEYRGQGFATIVTSKLIEYCLERGIEPHWDAMNELSADLALKIGYTNPEPYRCYYWRKEPWKLEEFQKVFDPQFEKGIDEMAKFQSAIEEIQLTGQVDEVNRFITSSYLKIGSLFKNILFYINIILETKIVAKSDEPQLTSYSEKIHNQLEKLERFRKALD
ncbi:MAG: GNAT family N-acetyltransferase [Candidatus Hodarchaeota archaeon]